MNSEKHLCRLSLTAFCSVMSVPAIAADIVIGVPAWPSAEVTANIIATVLNSDLGVDAELEQRGTLGILAAIDSGDVHVHPEVWLPNLQDAVDRFAEENGTLRLTPRGVPAAQNICVTKSTLDQTGIVELKDLADPSIAAQFDSNGDGKGEIWIGAASWSSTPVERVRAKSYGYDQTMTLLEAPEDVAMAAIDVSASLESPIVFYCYRPHHVFRLHEIHILAEPDHDPDTWSISEQDDPDEARAGSAWAPSSYHIGYATSLESSLPEVTEFLKRIDLGPDDAAAMSYAVQVEGKTPGEAAEHWMATNESRIAEWTQ